MKRLLLITSSFFIYSITFGGGGWPQPKGHGYFKFAQNIIRSSSFYGPDGSIVDITTISLYTTSIYGEYGFTNRLTGIVYFPFFVRSTLNAIKFKQSNTVIPGDSFNSIGDTNVAIKYGLVTDKPIVWSATLLLGLPLGSTGGGETKILQTGDGEFNQMVRLDASHSFYPRPFYVSAYAAFNNRTRNFSDEVRFGAEFGATFKKFTPILKVNVTQSLFNGGAGTVQNGIFSNNTEYVSPTLELNYLANDRWGLSGSAGFALSGKNILASPNLSLGAYITL